MTIKKVTNISEVLRLVPIEVRLREKEKSDVPVKDILTFIQQQLQINPYFGIWIVEEDDEVVGYVGLFANIVGGTRDVYMWRIWYEPHRHEVIKILYDIVVAYAEEVKAKKVRIEVTRGVKALERSWGFKPVATIMERRV